MKVKAKLGVQVPREDNPRRYLSDSEEQEVSASAYYLRRIADGDLIRVDETPTTQTAKPTTLAKTVSLEPAAPAAKSESESTSSDNGAK